MADNVTGNSTFEYEDYDASIWDVTLTADYLAIPLGTLTNLWLLLALLTSRGIRSRMRNKLICSLSFLYLLNSSLAFPIQRKIFNSFMAGYGISCHSLSAVHHVDLMQDFISNWTVVLMVAAFLTKTSGYKPCGGFKLQTIDIGTYAVLAFPWLASFVTVPAITHATHYLEKRNRNVSTFDECVFTTDDSYRVVKSLDTFVPLVAAVAMLVAAVVVRRRRFAGASSSGSKVHLLDGGQEVDKVYGYAAALVLTFTIDVLDVVGTLVTSKTYSAYTPTIVVTVYFLTQSKVYLSFLPWLLFPDIRERIKTWRPWQCARKDDVMTMMLRNV